METDVIKTYLSSGKYFPLEGSKSIHFQTFTSGNTINFKFNTKDFSDKWSRYVNTETIYLKVISNLIKKTEFLQLYIQLVDNQITEEEYEDELEKNSERYFFELTAINSSMEFDLLMDIVSKFPKQGLSMDDFSELFGISSYQCLPNSGHI